MNNSLPRLIDGMIASLRREVIPHTAGDYARGQAFGVIYMLGCIKRRAAWSNEFLGGQVQALEALSEELAPLASALPHAPLPQVRAPASLPAAAELEAIRDAGDARLCELIDWLTAHRSALPSERVRDADAAIGRYLQRQLRWELSTSPKPMFEEISRGADAASREPEPVSC